MKIRLLYIGKSKKNFYTDVETLFCERLSHYCSFSHIQIPPPKVSQSLTVNQIRQKEEEAFRTKLGTSKSYFVLDEAGKQFDSEGFAEFISRSMMSHSQLDFIIGGAYGVSDTLKKDSSAVLSLSRLTMPHHLARIVFLEQLYRAYTIINNQSYHNS